MTDIGTLLPINAAARNDCCWWKRTFGRLSAPHGCQAQGASAALVVGETGGANGVAAPRGTRQGRSPKPPFGVARYDINLTKMKAARSPAVCQSGSTVERRGRASPVGPDP